jgi:hypothetical protein
VLLIFIASPDPLAAAEKELKISEPPLSDELIRYYLQAVHTNHEGQIKEAWGLINQNPAVITRMSTHFPDAYYLFRVRGLLMELETVERQYSDDVYAGTPFEEPPQMFKHKRSLGSSFETTPEVRPAKRPSSDEALRGSELKLTPHQQPQVTGNTVTQSNREKALRLPNNERAPNQELIQRRLARLVPNEEPSRAMLRPGDFRDPTGAVDDARQFSNIRVRENPVAMSLAIRDGQGYKVDVYLNDQLVQPSAALSASPTVINLYLKNGRNRLRIVALPDGAPRIAPPTAVVEMPGVAEGSAVQTWAMDPQLSQLMNIDLRR